MFTRNPTQRVGLRSCQVLKARSAFNYSIDKLSAVFEALPVQEHIAGVQVEKSDTVAGSYNRISKIITINPKNWYKDCYVDPDHIQCVLLHEFAHVAQRKLCDNNDNDCTPHGLSFIRWNTALRLLSNHRCGSCFSDTSLPDAFIDRPIGGLVLF